jgi:HD-GYP domain-containing protein (c-di-GMP phosphodiesterase class II)
MRVLLFHSETDSLKSFAFWLESQLGFHIHQEHSLEKALLQIKSEEAPKLIVAGDCEQSNNLFKFIASNQIRTPMIFIGRKNLSVASVNNGLNLIGEMTVGDEPSKLMSLVQKNFSPEDLRVQVDGFYCRIHISLLLRIVPLMGDIYLKLGEHKYVKLFKKGTLFTKDDLNKIWHVKKLEYLYVHKSEAHSFMSKLQEDLDRLAHSSTDDDPKEVLNVVSEAQDAVLSLTNTFGFSPQVMEITQSSVKATLKAIGKSPKLSSLVFDKLLKNKNLVSSHSVMTAQVACCIALKLNWPSESTFHKLILASFLHDIALPKPEFALIRNKAQLNMFRDKLSALDFDRIKNHPYAAGEMVMNMQEVPQDVFTIITQHHEDAEGKGFPRGLNSASIAPLAAIFIIAEEVVHLYMQSEGKIEIEKYLSTQLPNYPTGTFRKIANSLKAA